LTTTRYLKRTFLNQYFRMHIKMKNVAFYDIPYLCGFVTDRSIARYQEIFWSILVKDKLATPDIGHFLKNVVARTVDWARWRHKALLRGSPRLSFALGPTPAWAGPDCPINKANLFLLIISKSRGSLGLPSPPFRRPWFLLFRSTNRLMKTFSDGPRNNMWCKWLE